MFKYEEAIQRLLCIFFPSRCVFCNKVLPPLQLECKACRDEVNMIAEPICLLCGCEKEYCNCKNERLFYDGVIAPYYYENTVRRALKNFKFSDNVVAANIIGEKMAQTAKREYLNIKFDMIAYVPMTRSKEKRRGYNQSALLSKEVARHMNLRVEENSIEKIYENDVQHDLNSVLRSGNIAGVYDVPDENIVKDKIILLCDDIKTTGETLNECAKMLAINGAAEIWCLVGALSRKSKKTENKKA